MFDQPEQHPRAVPVNAAKKLPYQRPVVSGLLLGSNTKSGQHIIVGEYHRGTLNYAGSFS